MGCTLSSRPPIRSHKYNAIRQNHGETKTELITRIYEHLLVLEYTGNPVEERRIFYFLVQALRDDNHRQDAAIQYQYVYQTNGQTLFEYWLNVVRTIPISSKESLKSFNQVNTTRLTPKLEKTPIVETADTTTLPATSQSNSKSKLLSLRKTCSFSLAMLS